MPGRPALCYYGPELNKGRSKHNKGSGMHIDPAECHQAMDYNEHQKTYKLFLKLTIATIVSVVVLMALLAVFVV